MYSSNRDPTLHMQSRCHCSFTPPSGPLRCAQRLPQAGGKSTYASGELSRACNHPRTIEPVIAHASHGKKAPILRNPSGASASRSVRPLDAARANGLRERQGPCIIGLTTPTTTNTQIRKVTPPTQQSSTMLLWRTQAQNAANLVRRHKTP